MKNRSMLGWVIGIPLLVVILILIIVFNEPKKDGISRAMAAKSLALVVLSPEELSAWQKEYGASHFPAETLKEWYVPYLDYLYEQGYLAESEAPADAKHAEGELTYGEAAHMAQALSPELSDVVKVTRQNREKPFPHELWWLFYDSVLRELDPEGEVAKTSVLIYGTPDNIPEAPEWTAYTNLGTLRFDGVTLDPYLDHKLSAYVRGTQLIHVLEDQGENPLYRNVWITDGDAESLSVFLGDIKREIPFRKKTKKTETMIGHLADIQMEKGRITKVSLKTETITGKILSVQEDAIELEGYGAVPLDDEVKVLKTYGEVERQKLSDILVGYDVEEFVVAKGKICAVLTVRRLQADTIRVLLMNNQFQGLFHPSITIRSEGAVTIVQEKTEQTVEAGQELTFTSGDSVFQKGRLILTPSSGQELLVTSLARAQGAPGYDGRLEIVDTQEGLVLINELYLEDYLKKVVPSEMPASYEMEALKAQAVCARTYAYMQLQSNTYSQYGAHIDDSTNFQVYNNIATDHNTEEAVQQTYGKMLFYEGAPISAYYFSTSCGTTADSSVWGSDPDDMPYLQSVALQPGRKSLELTDNDAFAAFIKKNDYPAYDADYPFYRWNATTTEEILTANIGGVGQVKNVKVTERGAGGVAQKLLVTGTEGEKTISGQNSIRAALGDASLTINRKDGKTTDGWRSLPSGFLTVDDLGTGEDGVHSFKIYGGGYGHGVGMSQNGAQGMAKDGMKYEDILQFYYHGVSVEAPE
ncbi:MAG: SpoIID/LytB domain-containing protein [Lachnospiraceae bacterium]|nr:SpoIID/LytB domain-containing protein [Lachnospiraceae bacterium]